VDEQVGQEICQRENIRGLICPTIGKVGNKFIVTARIVDPQSGDSMRSYAREATDYNQVLSALDGVVSSLRRGLGESLAQIGASNRPLAKVTTTSLSALKSYSEAVQLWTKQQHAAALALMQSAVKEDPDFAMAHAALGVFYGGFVSNQPAKAKEHYQKSLSLADRTTDREKMVIRLQYENRYGTADTARALFENYLRAYPDSIAQRYNYGDMLRNHGELDKAVGQYREVIRIAPDHAPSHINLATTYSEQGKTQEALASYERAFKLEPTLITSENLNHEYGFTLVETGEYEKARQVFTQGLSTAIRPAAVRSMALLHLYQGQYREARKELTEALVLNVSAKNLLSEARNHLFMSILLDGEGDSAGVQRELDKAARCLETLAPPPWLSARIGVAWARGRSIDKAARILEKVRKDVNPNNAGENSELHRLEGEVELARGNLVRGLELITLADRDIRGPLSLESLARAQQIAGKIDEAVASYEAFMDMLHKADGWEAQQYWFAAHTELAKLYIARKEPEKARRVLQELLDLWKGADQDLPLYKEAQQLSQAIAGGGR
jgi:tetratricopeptide (TPR) repeat protein